MLLNILTALRTLALLHFFDVEEDNTIPRWLQKQAAANINLNSKEDSRTLPLAPKFIAEVQILG